jgi:hypothetical protein
MAFCVNPKSKPLRGNTHEQVFVYWMCGSGSWLIGHIGLWDYLLSGISLQIWVGYVCLKPVVFSHWHFLLSSVMRLYLSVSLVCISSFFFCHIFTNNLPLTRSSVFTEFKSLPSRMHRLDWLINITWDGLSRMQLVCAFPHPLNHYRKDYRCCAGSNRSYPSFYIIICCRSETLW